MVLLEAFTPSTNPLGRQWASALVALIPIACMLITLGALRWKAYWAGLASWGLALIVAITAYHMPVGMAIASSAQGFLYGLFPIGWILLAAIWMYQVTVISGRFDDLRRTFFLISDDPRVLGILIAFCFGGLLEALAGFGAPVAIAAAMLIAVGFGKLRAAVTALVANTVPVAFGAVGLPVLMAARTSGLEVSQVSPVTARICAILCLVVPFLMLGIMDGKQGVKQCWPFGLFVGIIFGAVKWVIAGTSLYNLTEIFAAVVSVGLAMIFLRFWKPKGGAEAAERIGIPMDPALETEPVTKSEESGVTLTPGRIVMALVPYILVIVIFGIAAVPSVKALLAKANVDMAWPGLGDLLSTTGAANAHQTYTWQWLSTPGFLLMIVAILVGIIYKVSAKDLFGELLVNLKKMKFSLITIGLVVALAYVMGDSGQTLALGLFIAGAGAVYPFLAPILGWIGTYVTGSDTSANILFSGLQSGIGEQVGAAHSLGLDGMRSLLVGSGAAGGVVGKMISPQSLTVAATAIGLAGGESTILRKVFKYSIILIVFMCIIAGLMSTPVLSWLLP
ncbi:L-lactate permease [Propionibacterium australiense]|uniref:L-lactate permease n=1 Tax=Propionibacterium australiense TaxID=119981 RepID=A0A383S8I0_9ACTN|nr:L-lactate permease [Propionibacterium australiense]RLP06662.1 L-lactate permease [Propionibacterium australiense]RLP06699.1 L-lactate permease [Propionibacterium australiense]SYZ34300.1 lctP: transporter, lactate permease (LctP) family [Propionibacterium australiense]VEH92163.1 L-lactate permease [Propionibacterium australiense]